MLNIFANICDFFYFIKINNKYFFVGGFKIYFLIVLSLNGSCLIPMDIKKIRCDLL